MLVLLPKTGLLVVLTAVMLVLSSCGSSNSPEQRRVSSNPFAPAKSNSFSSRRPQSAPSVPGRMSAASGDRATADTASKKKRETDSEEATAGTDIITETSKYTLDSNRPGVAIIVRGVSEKIPEALPLIQKQLVSLASDQQPLSDGSAAPQLEQHVIDQQLVLVLRPAPADLFAFAQKLNCGEIKEIDIQKRIITVESRLSQLMALARNSQAENPGMDSDVKVSANSDSLRNMKAASNLHPVRNQPEKNPLPKSTIGTDRDIKPRPGEDKIDWALRVIAGSSPFAHDTACKELAKMEPDSADLQRVSALLAETLPLAKQGFRMPAHVNAMAVWYTDAATLKFARLLENEKDFLVRDKIIELLPAIRSETTAEVLVGRLSNRADMKDARRALRILGEIAEKPVIQLLNDPDSSMRIEACNILQSIGTAAAIAALKQRAENEDNAIVKKLLAETELKIQKRLSSGGQ